MNSHSVDAERVFVSVQSFAESVALSKRTVWALIRGEVVPVYRVGRRTLVKLDEGIEAIKRTGRQAETMDLNP